MKRSVNSNITLTTYIAVLLWSVGGYLVIKDYLQTGILNGPMVILLIIGIILTVLTIFRSRKK
ncbi:hypothetical protein [Lapidilactobacillus bayanensis]|uniref:hypothetical protein n=1 Tax=Lapidilactobacillus bayanensis TaxID=2485998 RepID=UPI000F79BE4E|nr:hypothetical protein [Lapidilactobacillus bayanensis]